MVQDISGDPLPRVMHAETDRSPAALVTLTYRVEPVRRESFLAFMKEAFHFYEAPGGIHMWLFEGVDEPGLFHEVAAYDSVATYDADQVRVEKDPATKAVLGRFHSFVSGPVDVKRVLRVK